MIWPMLLLPENNTPSRQMTLGYVFRQHYSFTLGFYNEFILMLSLCLRRVVGVLTEMKGIALITVSAVMILLRQQRGCCLRSTPS